MATEYKKTTDLEKLTRKLMNLDEGDRLQVISKGLLWTHYKRNETNFEINIDVLGNDITMTICSEINRNEIEEDEENL